MSDKLNDNAKALADKMISDWRAHVAINCQSAAKVMCAVRCPQSPFMAVEGVGVGAKVACGSCDRWRTYMDMAQALFVAGLLNLSEGP